MDVPDAVPQMNSTFGFPESTVKHVYPESVDPLASIPLARVIDVSVFPIGEASDVSKRDGAIGIVDPDVFKNPTARIASIRRVEVIIFWRMFFIFLLYHLFFNANDLVVNFGVSELDDSSSLKPNIFISKFIYLSISDISCF